MEVRELQWTADDGRLVQGPLSFRLEPGQTLAVLGPPRSGKTSLLEVLLERLPPLSGELNRKPVQDRSLDRKKRRCPTVLLPETYHYYGDLTVAADLRLLGRTLGVPFWRCKKAVHALLTRLGLPKERLAAELDRDQAALLMLARAISVSPELLLLDEPVEGLSLKTRSTVLELLQEQRDGGASIVWSTREPTSLPSWVDSVVLLTPSGCQGPFETASLVSQQSLTLQPPGEVLEGNASSAEPREEEQSPAR